MEYKYYILNNEKYDEKDDLDLLIENLKGKTLFWQDELEELEIDQEEKDEFVNIMNNLIANNKEYEKILENITITEITKKNVVKSIAYLIDKCDVTHGKNNKIIYVAIVFWYAAIHVKLLNSELFNNQFFEKLNEMEEEVEMNKICKFIRKVLEIKLQEN